MPNPVIPIIVTIVIGMTIFYAVKRYYNYGNGDMQYNYAEYERYLRELSTAQCNENIDEDKCAICYYHLTNITEIQYLPCSHTFHKICVNVWLNKNKTCPICRIPC